MGELGRNWWRGVGVTVPVTGVGGSTKLGRFESWPLVNSTATASCFQRRLVRRTAGGSRSGCANGPVACCPPPYLHHPPWPATNAAAASAAATAAAAVSAATAAGRRPRCRPCTSARPCSPRSRCPCPGCAKASGRVWRWRSGGSTPHREQWSSPGKWRITSAPPTLVCLTSSDTRCSRRSLESALFWHCGTVHRGLQRRLELRAPRQEWGE